MSKIGVGIITYKREEFFKNCVKSLPKVDELVVVNDGTPYDPNVYPENCTLIQHEENKCVGVSKNEALKHLIDAGCEHLFLIEDDMMIQNKSVFHKYIKAAKASGIYHLNFAYHGPANKDQNGLPIVRECIQYNKDVTIALVPNCVGSFSYYHKGIIKNLGYMDETFNNAWEHVEHTYRIHKAGLHPPFWWFADLADSHKYIKEQACSEDNTTISHTPEWIQNMRSGMEHFKKEHGYFPTYIPDTPKEQVLGTLKTIKENYSR